MTIATEYPTAPAATGADAARPGAPGAGAKAPGGTARVEVRCAEGWSPVSDLAALTPGRGVAALLPDGTQIAVFVDRTGRAHAVGNRDPFSGAYVLSRGLLGSVSGRAFVASPLLKQRFDLETGRCLDDDSVSVPAYTARVR